MPEATTRVILELPDSLLAEITEFRFVRRLPSRSEAFRRLLRRGLDAARADKPDAG